MTELAQAIEPGKIGADKIHEGGGTVRGEQFRFPGDAAVLVEPLTDHPDGCQPMNWSGEIEGQSNIVKLAPARHC
jgi:hypothetical protein